MRLSAFALAMASPHAASAADVPADPTNYQMLLGTLQPGDTLVLAAGTYTRLTIDGIHGEPNAWITVTGPEDGDPAVVVGESCCNTVQLYDSSFVAITNLVIDAQGLPVDAVNAKDSPSHDIRIEGNTMQGFPVDEQQIVGVNTKTTVWNWTIRGNTILEAGTGIYLGGSEGDTPFIAGLIENNVVLYPSGYCMQIKHQNDYAAAPDMPAGPNRTIIRNNVFIKDDRPSPDGDRPTLLVGGFPNTGPGADDVYDIYGNFLFDNPREAHLQATGRFSVHDNIFVGASPSYAAIAVTSHQGKSVKRAYLYNNTVFTSGTGISRSNSRLKRVSGTGISFEPAEQDDAVAGNLVFAASPISGSITDERDNLVASEAEATSYVAAPSMDLATMDFYPLPGAVLGSAIDMTKFADDPDFDVDYNGTSKGAHTFRGAYAGEGANPGCPLMAELEMCAPDGGDDGGSDESGVDDGAADESGEDGSTGGGATMTGGDGPLDGGSGDSATLATDGGSDDAGGDGESGSNSGCGCATTNAPGSAFAIMIALWAVRRRPRIRRDIERRRCRSRVRARSRRRPGCRLGPRAAL